MMAKVFSCAVVTVEVDISAGLPAFNVVGLPDTAVQEARERVRAAIRNSGCLFPPRRITVNLAPADLKKEDPVYDLPIAMGLLLSSEQVVCDTSRAVFLGELSLDGDLRHTPGVLPMVALAREKGFATVFLPGVDAPEVSLVDGLEIIPVDSLTSLMVHLRGESPLMPYQPDGDLPLSVEPEPESDLSHVRGQEHVRRALEVAAAGGHNVLMTGPPGSGKTLLARCLPSIMPLLTRDEALEVTKIYSISGQLPTDMLLIQHRPFRVPHYTISQAGLVGGGRFPRPGEISLSHRGVLFLDELPEFSHAALESLRQPMEDHMVTISRAQGTLTFPANFMLVAAMNPCPCGFYGDQVKQCTCSPGLISRYQKRISGPLLDRIDIFVQVPRVECEKLVGDVLAETSAVVRGRVDIARRVQQHRFADRRLFSNSDMTAVEVRECCHLQPEAQGLLRTAMTQLSLSARAFHRILKLSRTIADLAGASSIGAAHLAEVLQYRPRGQML